LLLSDWPLAAGSLGHAPTISTRSQGLRRG